MPEKKPTWKQIEKDRDEPVKLPLDPDQAVRALMETGPHPDPDAAAEDGNQSPPGKQQGNSSSPT